MVGRRHIYQWIPSHGKQLSWRPPAPFADELESWRAMNEHADSLATKGVKALCKRRSLSVASMAERDGAASSWALACLQHLCNTSDRYFQPFIDWASSSEDPLSSSLHGHPLGSQATSGSSFSLLSVLHRSVNPSTLSSPLLPSMASASTSGSTASAAVHHAGVRPRASSAAPGVSAAQAKRRKTSVGR